jgi:hypothetical protein
MQLEALREFISTVWGNPTLETNKTIIPKKLTNTGPRRVGFNTRNLSLKFPTGGSYHVYAVGTMGSGLLHKLTITPGKWLPLAPFCQKYDVNIRFGYLNTLEIPVHADIHFIYLLGTGLLVIVPEDGRGITNELHITIRSGTLVVDQTIVTEHFPLLTQEARDILVTRISNDPDVEYREYLIDNYWVDRPNRADIDAAKSVTIIDDTSVQTLVDYPLDSLDYYTSANKNYFLLHYPAINIDLMLNVNDIVVVLINNRKGHVIHTGAYPGTINQLTANACGLSAEVVESAISTLGWMPSDTTLRLRLATGSANKLSGNFNYQYVTKRLNDVQQYDALMGRHEAPDVLRAEWQHTSTRNKFLNADYDLVAANVEDIYGIGELDRLFNVGVRRGARVDNNFLNLVSTRLKVGKAYRNGVVDRVYPASLTNEDTALWMEHTLPMTFETQSVLLNAYNNPVIYKQTGGLAELGVDYRITDGAILPLSPVYITEMCSSQTHYLSENNQKLYIVPSIKEYLTCCSIHLFMNNVYLHPGIDYRIAEKGISIWKAITHGTLEVKVEPKLINDIVEQGFIRNNVLSVNNSFLVEDPENYVIYVGDKLYFPDEVEWEEDYLVSTASLANGKPYTILKRLMNDYASTFTEVASKRTIHQETLDAISLYANLTPPPKILAPTLYTAKYTLLSPFLVELLRRVANGTININPTYIKQVGLRTVVGADLLNELNNDRDPLAVEWGTQMVEVAPHIEPTPQPTTANAFAFLSQVSTELLGGKVAFRNYYRIIGN